MTPLAPKLRAALLALSMHATLAHALDAETLFQQVSPSIWVVNAMNAQGKTISAGSAVVIGPGRLVTNCHVLAHARSFTLRQGKVSLPGKLEFPDVERDLCQVRVEGLTAPAVTIAPSRNLRVGQKVFTLGAPSALEETISDGLLSALRLDAEGKLRFLQISAPISSGSSGGGLFNDKGQLIGITTAMLAGTTLQNLSFAVPAEWIWELEARGRDALAKRAATAATASAAKLTTTAAAAPTTATPAPTPAPAANASPVPAPVAVVAAPAPVIDTPKPQPPAASPPSAPLAPSAAWSGQMQCAARPGGAPADAAYQADFDVQVVESTVTLRRKDDKVAEALTGRIADGLLELKGVGYRLDQPDEIWKFRFTGNYQGGTVAQPYNGAGNMLLGRDAIRACQVTIRRT